MIMNFVSPRQVQIGDAAAFVGTTPRAVRHYHEIGLLPEPERGSDGRRRYGYDDVIRLMWIRRMADAGIALDDIRDAFSDVSGDEGGGTGGQDVEGVLERLERTLADQEAELQRQRAVVQRMRRQGSRVGLLDDFVSSRLEGLPEGSLRQHDLDTLLVTERMLSPLGAAFQADRFIVLATHPALREESDLVEAAEEALDDTVAVDDPRVAQVAARRHAFEMTLLAAIEASGQADDDALLARWDELHPPADGAEGGAACGIGTSGSQGSTSVVDALGMMPYDWSPARLRCIELAEELAAQESPAS